MQFGRSDVEAIVVDGNAGDTVDPASAFVDRLAASTAATGPCAGYTAVDTGTDGAPDRFVDIQFGSAACFDVIAKPNTTVAATAGPQVLEAVLSGIGAAGEALGSRTLYFVVPEAIETL